MADIIAMKDFSDVRVDEATGERYVIHNPTGVRYIVRERAVAGHAPATEYRRDPGARVAKKADRAALRQELLDDQRAERAAAFKRACEHKPRPLPRGTQCEGVAAPRSKAYGEPVLQYAARAVFIKGSEPKQPGSR